MVGDRKLGLLKLNLLLKLLHQCALVLISLQSRPKAQIAIDLAMLMRHRAVCLSYPPHAVQTSPGLVVVAVEEEEEEEKKIALEVPMRMEVVLVRLRTVGLLRA